MNTYTTDIYNEDVFAQKRLRASFIKKTYLNLAIALFIFALIEYFLMSFEPAVSLAATMVEGRNWIIVLLAAMAVSWGANKLAVSETSLLVQYLGLYIYVFLQAIICLPLLLLANAVAPDTIVHAGVLTAALSIGLMLTAAITGSDFSILRGVLAISSLIILGLVFTSILFGFELGIFFSAGVILFAAGGILYQTGQLSKNYAYNQYVASALGLFASVILLFFYVLRFMLQSRR